MIAVMVMGMTMPLLVTQTVTADSTPTITPGISINLMTMTGNTLRISWADLIAANLQGIGISASRVTLAEVPFVARGLYAAPPTRGLTYAQGGFDILFIGWIFAPEAGPSIYGLFDGSQWTPTGSNYCLWNNTQANTLDREMLHQFNQTALYNEIQQWQQIAYSQIPTVAIFYEEDIYPMNPGVNATPIKLAEYPMWPSLETWGYTSSYTGSKTKLEFEQPLIGFTNLNPYYTSWYYDLTTLASIYGEGAGYGLLIRNASNPLQTLPYMADRYTVNAANITWPNGYVSLPGTYWNFTLKSGIKFSNGEPLTGKDVVWTIRYAMTPAWLDINMAYLESILPSNKSVYWQGEPGTPGASETPNDMNVIFNITAPWATFRTDIGGLSILPASVLTNCTGGIPNYSQWEPNSPGNVTEMSQFIDTAFCTGVGSYLYYSWNGNGTLLTGTTPIGAGPYEFDGFNTATETTHLIKNPYYFNAANLTSKGEYTIDDFYIYGQTSGPSTALTDLKDNAIQVADTNYMWPALIGSITSQGDTYVINKGYTCQEMGFNMQNPIFGTGLATPLGISSNGTKAAQAALDVRLAIEAEVPKMTIIDSLLHGYGIYAVTTPVTENTFGFTPSPTLRNYTTQADANAAAIKYLEAAGYTVTYPPPPSFWDTYGLLLAVVELAVIVVLAGFYFFRPRKM
jgi:ABC-type transport system substrate-binding protein